MSESTTPEGLLAAWLALADESGRKHWHGGPDPCRVCGGMAPPRRQRRADVAARLAAIREQRQP